MGTAIVLGFTMMLIIDETFKILQINVASEAEEHKDSEKVATPDQNNDETKVSKKSVFITTFGLVVHSFADGAALGSGLYLSSLGQAEGLGMIIFLAIMLHKAPATLGFGSFVHHQGCRGWQLARHILAFTLSAPIVTILVYFGLVAAESEATDLGRLQWWVGILMLLSAGSFLYVATIHILPEVYAMDHEHGKTQVE